MRATTLIVILALASYAHAAIVDCSGLTSPPANGLKCTSTQITVNGNTIAANSPVTCNPNFYIVLNNAGTTTTCTAVTAGCALNAPVKSGAGATDASTPVAGTCIKSLNVPTLADGSDSFIAGTAAAADAVCANPSGAANPASTYYTPGALQTAAGGPFTATPINSWRCLACPTGCVDCTPTGTNTAAPAAATQTGCKIAGTGYYVNSAGTANTAGLFPIATCPATPVSATYGGNATACTACGSLTNCTAGTCATGFSYFSIANTTGLGNQTIGGKSVNLSQIPYGSSGPYQGCYNVDNLLAIVAANTAATNNTNSTTSASKITAGLAVVGAVAAVFAF